MLAFAIILVYDTFPKMSTSKIPFIDNSVLQPKRLQVASKDFCPARRAPFAVPNDMRERAPCVKKGAFSRSICDVR